MIGTNPIAIAAPAGRFGAFCLDMATSTIPRGRIEVAARRGETLPVGWAIDADGRPALTPEAALAGALHPLGGEEATAGYKGYGLSLAVDLLTGVLGGAAFGPEHHRPVQHRGAVGPRPDVHRHRPGGDRPGQAPSSGGSRATSSSSSPRRPCPTPRDASSSRASPRRTPNGALGRARRRHRRGPCHGLSSPRRPPRRCRSRPVERAIRPRRSTVATASTSSIVGGGIVGLATALPAARGPARPAAGDPREGDASSRRTSPVTTAACSMPASTTRPGSLKARLCREGKAAVEAFADAARHPVRASAASWSSPSTKPSCRGSRPLHERAAANGVPGLEDRRAGADPRDRAARRRDPRPVEPDDRDHRLPAGRPGDAPTEVTSARRRDPGRSRGSPRSTNDRRRGGRGDHPWRASGRQRHRLRRAPGRSRRRDDRRARPGRAADRPVPGRLLHPHARTPAISSAG